MASSPAAAPIAHTAPRIAAERRLDARPDVRTPTLTLVEHLYEVGTWCVAMRTALADLRLAAVRPLQPRVVCAWCLRVMDAGHPGATITHGICEHCEEAAGSFSGPDSAEHRADRA